jgi:2-polyprenyl-3-methyl-5-hydroxy-6-metoxy-1,4-benzoquinol methylase
MGKYLNFKVPVSTEIAAQFENAAQRLEQKLFQLDIERLEVSAYTKKYFKDYQRKLKYSLQACSFILTHALKQSGKKMEALTIVDYGAGTGVLAMLAKEVGFGKVIYNDIYDISCADAETIAKEVNVTADFYLCGDINSLLAYSMNNNQVCDIIVSRNVIEHIYNLDDFFKVLSSFPNNNLTLFFATTANIKNPLTVWYTQRIQRKLEYKGMKNKWGKDRDTSIPFIEIRKDIIKQAFPELYLGQIVEMAKATRGMIKPEIIQFVQSYINTGIKGKSSVNGCNTCDPNTGNWAEHLVEIEKYNALFIENGFTFNVDNGFYNTNYNKRWLNLITPFINLCIKILGIQGIYLAPFIGLTGKKASV